MMKILLGGKRFKARLTVGRRTKEATALSIIWIVELLTWISIHPINDLFFVDLNYSK